MPARHRKDRRMRSELGEIAQERVEEEIDRLQLVPRSHVGQIAGEDQRVPGPALGVEVAQIAIQLLAQLRF